MKAVKITLNNIEFILPEQNAGMLEVRGLEYEEIEVDTIPNIMEDVVRELSKN